jgi:hypothetical protein
MPPLTEFERSLRTGFFRKANGLLKGKTRAALEVPMLSQVGNVMKSAGIEHLGEMVKKRILMMGKPLNPAAKTASAPPTSSHHGAPARRPGKLEIPQMDSSTKISAEMDKEALTRGRVARALYKRIKARPQVSIDVEAYFHDAAENLNLNPGQSLIPGTRQFTAAKARVGKARALLTPGAFDPAVASERFAADEALDLIKASLLMPRVGGLLSGAKMPLSAAKGIVRGAEKRVTPSAMWSGAQGSGARAQLKQEGVTPRSATYTPGRGHGIPKGKPAIFAGGGGGARPSLAPKPAPMADPWSHARVAAEDAREMLKASVSGKFIARGITSRLAKAMEAAGHSTAQVRERGVAEVTRLSGDMIKPKSLTHGLSMSHVREFSKAVPKPAMMPA